ncbi:MAG: methyltransferase domain-containing protein [Acidobacteria bacterium]|nr:methyltransferase domain-containing protein [Acidobacteriota bacterium]
MHRKLRILPALAVIGASLALGAVAPGDEGDPGWMRTPDVVYVGTPYDVVSTMLRMAGVKKQDVVYDLGCGDGRMLVLAAQKYGCRAVGYDIDPVRVRESRENVARNGVGNLVEIIQEDIFKVDLAEATVLPIYLLPEMNRRLLPQLEKLKPGSRIVCHDYGLDGIIPDETRTVISNEDNASHILMLYTTPLRRN